MLSSIAMKIRLFKKAKKRRQTKLKRMKAVPQKLTEERKSSMNLSRMTKMLWLSLIAL